MIGSAHAVSLLSKPVGVSAGLLSVGRVCTLRLVHLGAAEAKNELSRGSHPGLSPLRHCLDTRLGAGKRSQGTRDTEESTSHGSEWGRNSRRLVWHEDGPCRRRLR